MIALGAVALLAIAGQVVVQVALSRQRQGGHLVNEAGYQRMLSQRLALKLVLASAEDADGDAAARVAEIGALRDRWVATHAELLIQLDAAARDDRERAQWQGVLAAVERPMRTMVAVVERLEARGVVTVADLAQVLAAQDSFLPQMDAAVRAIEKSVTARVATLQRIELTLLALVLIALGLEAWLVFQPLARRLESTLGELEERRARVADRLESLRGLAGGIAHRFNNMLQSVMGYGELMRMDAQEGGRSTEFTDAQIAECRGAADLVAQLQLYSGNAPLERKPTALAPWLRGRVEGFSRKYPGADIELVTADDVVAEIDLELMRKVVDGVVANAREAIAASGDVGGGVVRLALRQEVLAYPRAMAGPYRMELPGGRYATIAVTDSGPGLAAEEIERIFDPFYTRKTLGRGLGLAAVLGAVHAHGGGVEIASSVGQGATLTLYLPAGVNRSTRTGAVSVDRMPTT